MSGNQLKVFKMLKDDFMRRKNDDLWTPLAKGLEESGCADHDYLSHTEGRAIEDVISSINRMSFNECCTWLTWIVRGERFCEGLFTSCLDDGTLLALLTRACDVLSVKDM